MRQISEITHNNRPLAEILDAHAKWLRGEDGGVRANLRGADLRLAYLIGADLAKADLRGAVLSGTYLRGTSLNGADLSGAIGIVHIGPTMDGYEFFGVVRDGTAWIKAGCRWFTAADARAHWQKTRAGTPEGAERLAFVDCIEAAFRARGDIE